MGTFNEQDHPRHDDGRFAGKPKQSAHVDLSEQAPSPYDHDDPYQAFLDQAPDDLFPPETRERDLETFKSIAEYHDASPEAWEDFHELRTGINRVQAVEDCQNLEKLWYSLYNVAHATAAPNWGADQYEQIALSLDGL